LDFQIIERELGAAITETVGDTALGREWLEAQMADIRELVVRIGAFGGAACGEP